ncbi:hypothetical protein OPV22_018583 [Ensete ventricosum]|uniref:Uncharacterized protein n=1 Tax=Ensete ventricosum TaxID=4639 RepID=A0AAV8QYY7_ENSVE|nr:hypothetical protein OPV22_018583 [Ensete ventricosum]
MGDQRLRRKLRSRRGTLGDEAVVAIEKSKDHQQDQNGAVHQRGDPSVTHINHRSVAKLQGCFSETQVPWMVYELIPNGESRKG